MDCRGYNCFYMHGASTKYRLFGSMLFLLKQLTRKLVHVKNISRKSILKKHFSPKLDDLKYQPRE